MFRNAFVCLLAATALSVPTVLFAKGGSGGGGSTAPATYRYVGLIVNIVEAPEGVYVTLGTSYYAVGTVLVVPDTKIKFNGTSNASASDLRVGDTAQVNYYWPSRIAVSMEVTGVR